MSSHLVAGIISMRSGTIVIFLGIMTLPRDLISNKDSVMANFTCQLSWATVRGYLVKKYFECFHGGIFFR